MSIHCPQIEKRYVKDYYSDKLVTYITFESYKNQHRYFSFKLKDFFLHSKRVQKDIIDELIRKLEEK